MKVSTSSKKEPSTKVKKLEENLISAKAEIKALKKQNVVERKKTRLARQSRDNWKAKSRIKGNEIKGLKKKIQNIDKPKGHHYEVNMINLCILLRIVGGCSYRSIPRILKVLRMCFDVPFEKTPCANSIENWVSKLGLHLMENAVSGLKEKNEGMCLIIDENLRIGNERMLLFLITPSKKEKQTALKYEDVEVIYICGKKSWTGEKIKKEVEKIMKKKEIKIDFILSDEDNKLLKSARLLEQSHLPDIGHAIGTCLRRVFKKDENFLSMIKLIGLFQSKSVHQDLSYLRPPKQRIKARFMNLSPIIKWSITILTRFDELEEEEQLFFKELVDHKAILYTLNSCMELSDQISNPLKLKGLNQSTLKNFKLKLTYFKIRLDELRNGEVPTESEREWIILLLEQYVKYLEKYAEQYKDFLGEKKQSYPVSSDVIESIFGKHKSIVSTNGLIGMTILDLELPVHCQSKDKIQSKVQIALEDISMTDLGVWRQTHSSDNQALKRSLFFKKRA